MRSTISIGLIAMACLLGVSCAGTRPVHYYTLGPACRPANQGNPDGVPPFWWDHRHSGISAGWPHPAIARAPMKPAPTNTIAGMEQPRRDGSRLSLVRALRASGKYRRVMESSSSAIGDYLVRGKLYEFGKWIRRHSNRISLHLELVDRKTAAPFGIDALRARRAGQRQEYDGSGGSMDRNLRQVTAEAAAEIGRGAGL